MKSTSYPPPNDKHNSSSFRSLALGKLFKPTALSLLIASLALPALSQARDYNNSDLDEKSVLFSLNDDAEDIGNIDLSIEANARNSFS